MKYFKNKYKFNNETLTYEKIPITSRRIFGFILLVLILTASTFFTVSTFYNTPKEVKLKNHIGMLVSDVFILNRRIDGLEDILSDIETMDSIVYRSIFDSQPFYYKYENETKKADSLYNNVRNNKDLVDLTHRKINKLENKITDQYYDLEYLKQLSLDRQDYLQCVPSIQPISNEDLRRTASGWGWRIHPIYKIRKFHYGLDFSAKTGTSIYATGKAKVYYAGYVRSGYGKVVILDHGYGYKSLYGHMNKIYVDKGDNINRGDIIGEVGSTGSSTGPHLHYEVMLYRKKVNPVHYFFNDLTPKEYEQMIEISSQISRTYD